MPESSHPSSSSEWPIDQELLAVFRDEVEEQLSSLSDLLDKPPSRWNIDELFRIGHNVKGGARLVGAASIEDVAHQLEDLFSVLRSATGPLDRQLVSLAREGALLLRSIFERIGKDAAGSVDPSQIREYRERVATQLPDTERASSPEDTSPEDTAPGESASETAAPDETKGVAEARPAAGTSGGTLRVPVSKLDQLLEFGSDLLHQDALVGQVRQQGANLARRLESLQRHNPELRHIEGWHDLVTQGRELRTALARVGAEQERMSKGIRSATFGLRMMPISALRSVLSLAVREAGQHYGRPARLSLEGGDTEVDRGVLEILRDPLVHLARNAVAHGLESAETRRSAGKDEIGTVVLRAGSDGSWVRLELDDDGAGLDLEAIQNEARRRHLPVADAEANDADRQDALRQWIFSPGFTTVQQADSVSGRGVGLDIVRRSVEALGGEITVDSRPAEGTSFRLRVPASKLTAEGLVVQAAGRLLILPATAVARTVFVDRAEVRRVEGRDCVRLSDESLTEDRIEVLSLADALHLEDRETRARSSAQGQPAVVVSDGERRKALWVDAVIGRADIIVQPLPWNLRGLPGIAACTVLAGTEAVPVLDGAALVGARGRGSVARQDEVADRASRVLVADDSVTSRTLESNILTNAGFQTVVAVDGEEAWELLQRHDIDLLVSDVDMPRLSGLELTRRVRADSRLQHLPVILVTSLTGDFRRRGAAAGADAYIVKGEFDQDELLEAVGRLI